LQLVLPVDLKQSLVLVPEKLEQNISEISEALTQFYVVSCQTTTLTNGSGIIVGIKLKRIFSYHLTNTYMPTITLLIIAHITLHFDETKTELAIGLSLTIMLVMYTMYQSISGSLVKTAYLKMIDYWLLFCLLMPLVIFLIEIYWLQKKTQKLNATMKGWVTNEKKLSSQRKIIQNLAHCISLLFVILYMTIALVLFYEDS
jgi:hypothetical protein